MRKMASPHARDLIAIKRGAHDTIKYPRMACRYPWTRLDSKCLPTQTLLDVPPRGSPLLDESRCGARSRTVGILALCSGESDLAVVVRAAAGGMGLQSVPSDFGLFGHVAIKFDATASIGTVHRLGGGEVRHLAAGGVQHHVRLGKIRVTKVCQDRKIRVMHKTKYFGPETTAAPHESV